MQQIPHYINGTRVADAERFGPVFDPATGEQEKEVALASPSRVDEAVRAAEAALPGWRSASLAKRAAVFYRVRHLLTERKSELAAILTSEHGKVLSDAEGEISRGLENIEFATGLGHMLKGERSEQVSTGVDVHSIRQPVGVVACITPFNFPAMVPLWMIGSAIACGNTVLLKPSEKDPSSSVFIAELFTEAGLPDGVLNVVHGDREAVETILDHPGVKAVSFVGSTPIAKTIYTRAAANGKRVQALGGAKNHMVVLPDADLDMAADAAISAAYGSAGERCMAISVVVAVGDIADGLVEAIRSRMTSLRIGPGTDPASEMGPLITAEHRERVASYVTGAEAEGATVVVDGTRQHFDSNGFFIGVSLVDHVKPGMKVYDDEIFGTGALRRPGGDVRRRRPPRQREPVRQRRRHLHARRRRRAAVRGGGRGRDGGRERPHPGAGGYLLLRRLEGLAVRRHAHVRSRQHPLLHAWQGGHHALAGPVDVGDRPRVPAGRLSAAGARGAAPGLRART
ncbi:hypothetical protein MN0502_08050 [Arthrobacter sp. MN05-02]|nr:hypothetical protein MN0502_08050 [Arthrobacter sp. MN05-02]